MNKKNKCRSLVTSGQLTVARFKSASAWAPSHRGSPRAPIDFVSSWLLMEGPDRTGRAHI